MTTCSFVATSRPTMFGSSPDVTPRVSAQDAAPSDVDVVGFHPKLTAPDRGIVGRATRGRAASTGSVALRSSVATVRTRTERYGERIVSCGFRSGPRRSEPSIHDRRDDVRVPARRHATAKLGRRVGDSTRRSSATWPGLRCAPTLEEMWSEVLAEVTTTPASSEIGRLAQLLKAAGLTAPIQIAVPAGPEPGSDADLAESRRVVTTRGSVQDRSNSLPGVGDGSVKGHRLSAAVPPGGLFSGKMGDVGVNT